MKKKEKYNILDKIKGIFFILLFPETLITLVLAGCNIISAGIPIIGFGTLFILLSTIENDNHSNKHISFMPIGFGVIAIGVSILCKSILAFVYSFINIFGIIGLTIVVYLINTYKYDKKSHDQMINSKNRNKFYKLHIIEIILASFLIATSIIGNYFLLTMNFPIE